jgi:Peptidase M50B-like
MIELFDRVLRVQPAPPISVVAGTAVVALIVVMWRRSWRLARNAITIAHEGGHGLVAVLSGRRLQGIRLHSDTSGLTLSRGKRSGPGMVLTLAAGYCAPSLLGVGGAALLASGRLTLLLWLSIVLAFLMLVMIRNVYGVLSVLVTGAILFGVSWYADAKWQAVFAYAAVWFLLIGGVRPVLEVQGQRRRGQARFSDPDQLAGVTRVAGGVWVGIFLLVCVGSLAVTALLLGLVAATRNTSLFN